MSIPSSETSSPFIGAFGLPNYAPQTIRRLFTILNVTWTEVTYRTARNGAKRLYWQNNLLAREQPAWVMVVYTIEALRHATPVIASRASRYYPAICFVIDCKEAIETTNLGYLSAGKDLTRSVAQALQHAASHPVNWKLEINEPTIDEYVKAFVKPSFFNDFQTAMYRIAPYALQRDARLLSIAWFAGEATNDMLKRKLDSSYKLNELAGIMLSDRANQLRAAVACTKKNGLAEAAKLFDFEDFEINYVIQSYRKSKEDEANAAAGIGPRRGRQPKRSDRPRG